MHACISILPTNSLAVSISNTDINVRIIYGNSHQSCGAHTTNQHTYRTARHATQHYTIAAQVIPNMHQYACATQNNRASRHQTRVRRTVQSMWTTAAAAAAAAAHRFALVCIDRQTQNQCIYQKYVHKYARINVSA